MIKTKINNNKSTSDNIEQLKKLKHKKNAILLAHYYQIPEIQELADFVGIVSHFLNMPILQKQI